MNFTQMHERLRLELLRRMQRGTLSVSLLARQTGFGQAHLSNFLRSRRQLSLEALDRVLAAQHLTAADLLPVLPPIRGQLARKQPVPSQPGHAEESQDSGLPASLVPLVSHHTALFEPYIRPAVTQAMLHAPAGVLQSARHRAPSARRAWERFVFVRISTADALAMRPLLLSDALALIDRHYNSLIPYHPDSPNLFAVRHGAHLTLRYVDFTANRLVLRPLNLAFPVDLIEVEESESPSDLIVGRVALILNEI